ncbi:MAG: AAA family ATPase [Nocardioidaceae bacterium]
MEVRKAAHVLERLVSATSGRLTLACIEGLGGSGKSTLAATLVDARPDIQLIHGDDFYGPEGRDWRSWVPREGYERYFDHRRLERELLQPIQRGDIARFRRYDWASNALNGWIEVQPHGVVLVEGVYLLRAWLRPYWDFSVYVATPRHLRLSRAYARGENDAGWIERWAAAEDYYEAVERPSEAADLVVPGY